MIDREFCKNQVLRLSGTKYFSALPDAALRELIATIQRVCATQEQAKNTITELLETHVDVPSCADIFRVARAFDVTSTNVKASIDCEFCNGSGFEIRVLTNGVTGAARCRCGGVPPTNEAMTPDEEKQFARRSKDWMVQ